MSQTSTITAGFLPLTDSLLLVAAHEQGFAEREGLSLRLVREASWANIRDRIGVGHFDVAHMLAPLPIAANLGLAPLPTRMIAPMTLGHGGNAITVSLGLWERMRSQGAPADLNPAAAGAALASVVAAGGRRLRFGVVHQNSSHNLELRYWLAASGIIADRDIEIVVLPPPLLPDALAEGTIDGYCVGEPWNSVGVDAGAGRIIATKSLIWPSSPDKVLGMREAWALNHPESAERLIRAMHKAAIWCGDPVNLDAACEMMASPSYLDKPADLIRRALTGALMLDRTTPETVPNFYVPHAGAANYPARRDALWFYSQMVRWGEVPHSAENARLAADTFRPDLYRAALGNAPEPSARTAFFDGEIFDPDRLDSYIESQSL